ncbi:MAG: cysteine desulfurase [Verrucomicrobia bacterium]|nr:MAG: cysteine desulfurase [Verrucomicrobiota bacterium]
MSVLTSKEPAEIQALSPQTVRADFPALDRIFADQQRLVYLDNAATTQKPRAVLEATRRYYEESAGNVHRAVHRLAAEATELYEAARQRIAKFIGAPSTRSMVFTHGATEGFNLVAYGWARKFLKAGDEILVTEMEHHSNFVPWQRAAQERGAVVRIAPILEDGTLDRVAFARLLTPRVKLVAVTHASNVLGTVNPVAELIAAAHAIGALALVDAAQSAPHLPLDVRALDADFLAFSGHKMLGPTGIGVLYARETLLEAMDPFLTGGEMISKVFDDHATWADIPQKFEAGTPHIAGAIGLGAAVDYLERLGRERVRQHEQQLTAYALERLGDLPGLRIFGRAPERVGVISFALDGVHPHDVAQFCDQTGVAIRAGHLCAQPLMHRLDVPALSRASLYLYNATDDVDRLVEALQAAQRFFHAT